MPKRRVTENADESEPRVPAVTFRDRDFDPATRERMYRALESEDVEAAYAVLDIIQRAGDQAARPHVQRLIDRVEQRDFQPVLLDRARACLESLRAAADRAGKELLRPVEPQTGENLLRPAAGAGPADPDRLLRGTTEQNGPDNPRRSP